MNIEELKQKALAVINCNDATDGISAGMEFMEAVDPAAVLELIRQRDELLAALKDARELVDDWGAYASNYMQEKRDLAGDLAKLDAVIAKAEG